MAKIFWDTNLFIYLFEEHPEFADLVVQVRRRMLVRGDQLFTSALTLGEVLVEPLTRGKNELADRYEAFFRGPSLAVIPFDHHAARFYARIRQDRSIRRPDAIQLACAATAGIDLFITNDAPLSQKVVPGIQFISNLQRAPL